MNEILRDLNDSEEKDQSILIEGSI